MIAEASKVTPWQMARLPASWEPRRVVGQSGKFVNAALSTALCAGRTREAVEFTASGSAKTVKKGIPELRSASLIREYRFGSADAH